MRILMDQREKQGNYEGGLQAQQCEVSTTWNLMECEYKFLGLSQCQCGGIPLLFRTILSSQSPGKTFIWDLGFQGVYFKDLCG